MSDEPEPVEPVEEPRPTEATAEPGFLARIGMAIVRPRHALEIGGDRRHAGRSGSDLIAMILVLLVSTQLRGLVSAVMLLGESGGDGLRAFVTVLTRSLVLDLVFLVLGALLVWTLSGRRRNLGRAFDIACVAALPLLFVDIAATFAMRALNLHVTFVLALAFSVISWAWTGALLALSLRAARSMAVRAPGTPVATVGLARRAGLGVIAVAAAGLAIQLGWIATHTDDIRPVMRGGTAPDFSLPTIVDATGRLGPPRRLAASRGKVTVIDFWATWCGPCRKTLPKLQAIARKPGVEVLAVDLARQDDPGEAFAMFAEAGYTMTLLADDGEVSDRYNVHDIPHTVVIDREGRVHWVWRGAGSDLEAIVDQILK